MATIGQIRTGIATALGTISGLHAHDIVPDSVVAPAAVVYGPEVDYDATFGTGHDDYRFWVILLVSRADARSGQELLDTFLASTGASSVKAAIEGNLDLAGIVDSAYVKEVREYETRDVNGVPHYAAALLVEVMT